MLGLLFFTHKHKAAGVEINGRCKRLQQWTSRARNCPRMGPHISPLQGHRQPLKQKDGFFVVFHDARDAFPSLHHFYSLPSAYFVA